MKYAIVLDLDGTLLDDAGKISDYNKRILNQCKSLGCKIIINSTRNYMRTLQYKEEINADYINCFNGNYVIGTKTIYKNNFSSKLISKILDILENNQCNFLVECLNGTFRNSYEKYNCIESYYINIRELKLDECYKFLIYCDKDNVFTLTNLFNKLNVSLSYDDKNNFLRVMPKATDKYIGLSKIQLSDYKFISFGNDKEDLTTLQNSFIGVKMENSDNSLNEIVFSTSSNNNNGVGKFLNNYFNFDLNSNFENIKILDCTLRDGGHLNNSEFGFSTINKLISNLCKANIDIVEIGFLENCIYNKDKAKYSKVSEAEKLLESIDCKNTIISLLTQVDKYDISNLEICTGKVKMIRISFHNAYIEQGIEYCKKVKEKGYICCCNPINFSSYSKEEIIELVKKINKINIDYFTIVDTFGTLLNNDFTNKLNLLSDLLKDDIKLALHLHNNLSSSFSTAQILLQQKSRFTDVIIDTSLEGMGRSPGNLKTELLAYYVNTDCNKYNLKYIYDLLQNDIKEIRKKYKWDLDFRYSISAFEKVHRSYAEYLINHNISYFDSQNIIKEIPSINKGRYNEDIIENIVNKFKGE